MGKKLQEIANFVFFSFRFIPIVRNNGKEILLVFCAAGMQLPNWTLLIMVGPDPVSSLIPILQL